MHTIIISHNGRDLFCHEYPTREMANQGVDSFQNTCRFLADDIAIRIVDSAGVIIRFTQISFPLEVR